jgi:hypothetical protein
MYYDGEEWKLLKEIKITAVSFPAFIVIPNSDNDEIKFTLFIFGGLE